MKNPLLLRVLALTGFGICAYLGVLKLTGQISSIKGCGAGSGCANVLGSEWSQFLGVPVSVLAGVLYLGLFAATWRPSRPLYLGFLICLAGAAAWFLGLLYIKMKAFCPWCAAMHSIGIFTSIVLAAAVRHLKRPEKPEKPFCYAPPAAGAGLLILILGQVYGPKPPTHAATTEVLGSHRAASEMGKGTGEQGAVRFFSGRKEYNTITMPHLGPSDASHVLVKYFDYTCRSCRDVHADLQFVAEKHPGSFCVILLPVPLHRDCNPFYPADLTNHDHACELARLSLAAWRAKPALWPEVHEQLFSQPVLPPEVAEAAVGQIVGHDELTKALEDPWINEHLESNVNDFKQMILTTRAMPKMVIGDDQVLHGVPRSKEVLLQTLGQHYKLN